MINDQVTMALRAALDLRLARQELLSNNIANADTPGFQPTDLAFEGVLEQELARGGGQLTRTSGQHLPTGVAHHNPMESTVERPDVVDSLDGNGVDTDRELARVAENSLQYRTTLEVVRRRYGIMKQTLADMGRT